MKKTHPCRIFGCFALAKLCLLAFVGCHASPAGGAETSFYNFSDETVTTVVSETTGTAPSVLDATYLGVVDYGKEGVTAEGMDTFTYRFLVDGKECRFAIYNGNPTEEGLAYPIQNVLHVGASYRITVEKDTIIAAEPLNADDAPAVAPVADYTPGERTLKNFLSAALAPMGSTLYVYGGGWNWQDDGSSVACKTIGVSPAWGAFFEKRNGSYTYRGENSENGVNYYPFGGWNEYYFAGLDCSGYVGWTLYNTLHAEDGLDGYVMSSTRMASTFAAKGWGTFDKSPEALRPGDIVSMQGHVWICLGRCEDGSLVIAHSTPSASRDGQPGGGVQLTALGENESCEAYLLVDRYMSRYFSTWYQRYPASLRNYGGYTNFSAEHTGRFSWNLAEGGVLSDPDGMAEMTAEQVLAVLFDEAK